MGREKDSDDNPRNGMAGFAQKIAQYLPEVNFITIHYGILWQSENNRTFSLVTILQATSSGRLSLLH